MVDPASDSRAGALADSLRFHRDLETLHAFCRREKIALLFFGLVFSLSLIAFILLVDESFFYSRVQTDALWYYLKGRAFAETGHTTVRMAINSGPINFQSTPGVLRAPLIRVLSSFDAQLRAIQLVNVVIMDAVAVMSAYILSWVVPRRWHWLVIGFTFAFSLVAPWWIQNVFMPLTDAPYAALSLASMLIAIAIMRSERPATQVGSAIAFATAAAGAFLFRFTEPAVLLLVGALLLGRRGTWRISRRGVGIVITVLAVIGILVAINRQTFFFKYGKELLFFAIAGEKTSMLLNLFCLAIPQQIIPAFDLGFSHPPILGLNKGEFAGTPSDAVWSFLGLLISAVVVAGTWRSRRRLGPEIVMILAVLPALVLLMPSTPRYLMTYQAFFWIWFYEGSLLVAEAIPARMRVVSRATALGGVAAALAIGLALGLKHRGLLNRGRPSTSSAAIASYVHGQTGTYRPLAKFMETLPRDRTLLITINPTLGRWTAISGLDYYTPDSATGTMAAKKDMYLVLDCGSPPMCETFSRDEAKFEKKLSAFGNFRYEPVFKARAEKSRAEVFRVRVEHDSLTEPGETQKGNP